MTNTLVNGHLPSCFRGYIVLVSGEDDSEVSIVPSYSGRWECPECSNRKLGKKLERAVVEVEQVSVGWVATLGLVQRQANYKQVGYQSIRLEDTPGFLVVADVALGRSFDSVDMTMDEALVWLRQQLLGKVVKRVNLSNYWRSLKSPRNLVAIAAHKDKSYEEVVQGVVDAGYPEMVWSGDRGKVVERIREEVKGYYDPELGMFNTR